jgi:predicted MFS family arabinose efflux permease
MAAAGILIMGFAKDEMFFVLAAVLVGVGLSPGGTINNVYALASGLSKEAEAASVASLQRMIFLGQIIGGFAIAGLLQSGLSFQVLFAISAGMAVICLLLALFAARGIAARVADYATKRVEKANEAAPPGKFSLGDLFKSTFGLTLLAIFLNHMGWTGVVGQYTNFFRRAFGIDPSITSSVNSIAVALSLVVIGLAGKWMGRAGPVPVASVGMALRVVLALALAAIGWALGGASGALALPLLVWTTLRLVNPLIELSNPVLAARTAVGGATQAQALMTAVFALAISLGNLLGGQLAENFGWLALPWQTVVFCTLAFLVTYFGVRPRLEEGSNEPDPEMLLAERELET